jgi:hypothetical protein
MSLFGSGVTLSVTVEMWHVAVWCAIGVVMLAAQLLDYRVTTSPRPSWRRVLLPKNAWVRYPLYVVFWPVGGPAAVRSLWRHRNRVVSGLYNASVTRNDGFGVSGHRSGQWR